MLEFSREFDTVDREIMLSIPTSIELFTKVFQKLLNTKKDCKIRGGQVIITLDLSWSAPRFGSESSSVFNIKKNT